jgi:hypothetical protein
MRTATTRAIIAAAGLATLGLVAWPHQATTPQSQQGVPTVHRDVALVDVGSTLLTDEGTLDNALWNDVLGPTGAEETLYTDLGSNAQADLDTFGASPAYSGDFNGAESRLFEALFADTLATEDQINQALGVSATDSQTELLSVFNTDFVPLPNGVSEPVVGTDFDSDLQAVANGDLTTGESDLLGYADYLATNFTTLDTSLGSVLTDLGTSFSDLSNLSTDLSTVLTDLGGLL